LISLAEPKSHKWRQGTIIPAGTTERIRAAVEPLAKKLSANDLLVVGSHSCDLCCESLEEEPDFEVVVCRSLSEEAADGNLLHGKNPRRLQLRVPDGNSTRLVELSVKDRFHVPRTILSAAEQQPTHTLSQADTVVFRRWLGRRYYRSDLPTEFNERCRPAQRVLSEKLKKVGGPITGIYLQIDPREEELNAESAYRVYAHLTIRRNTAESPDGMGQALKAQAAVEAAFLKCEGIEFLGVQVISEAEFSLEDLDLCARWDYSDYTSYRSSPPQPLAPEA
jgi:hypothetical protein